MSIATKVIKRVRRNFILGASDFCSVFQSPDYTFRNSKPYIILTYHGLCKSEPSRYNSRFITTKLFEQHLQLFIKHFEIVGIDEIQKGMEQGEKLKMVLTFDDGYLNNFNLAKPILEKYNVPATFCITGILDESPQILWSDYLDIAAKDFAKSISLEEDLYQVRRSLFGIFSEYVNSKGEKLKTIAKFKENAFKQGLIKEIAKSFDVQLQKSSSVYWKQMNRDQIKELSRNALFTIASHGYYHNNLGAIEQSFAEYEMTKSKSLLEEITEKEIAILSYPDGSYSKATIDLARNVGYRKQLVVEYNKEKDKEHSDLFERFTINPYISSHNQTVAFIKGQYI